MKQVPQARLDLADTIICMCGRRRVPDQRLAVSLGTRGRSDPAGPLYSEAPGRTHVRLWGGAVCGSVTCHVQGVRGVPDWTVVVGWRLAPWQVS